jgi:hypothetical protein
LYDPLLKLLGGDAVRAVLLDQASFGHVKKATTLREVRRVLTPGATFHMLDLATPDSNSAGPHCERVRGLCNDGLLLSSR